MQNILKESQLLQKLHGESTETLHKQYNEIHTQNENQRHELNENILKINNEFISAKQLLNTNYYYSNHEYTNTRFR